MFVIERQLPADKRIKVRVYLRQSRNKVRNLGEALHDLQKLLGGDAFGIVTDIVGSEFPWLVVAKKAFPMIGKVLSNIKDRDMGLVTMDEYFGDEYSSEMKVERHNTFSTGEAKIWWKWSVKS